MYTQIAIFANHDEGGQAMAQSMHRILLLEVVATKYMSMPVDGSTPERGRREQAPREGEKSTPVHSSFLGSNALTCFKVSNRACRLAAHIACARSAMGTLRSVPSCENKMHKSEHNMRIDQDANACRHINM